MHTYINKWRPIEIAVLLALAVTLLVGAASLHRQDGLQEKMIRLHVIANSDSEGDQAMKLLARDAVLTRAEAILRQASNREEAMEDLNAALPELERTAYDACGGAYPVHAALEMAEFPRKEYEGFALPAGEYMALRVIIGRPELVVCGVPTAVHGLLHRVGGYGAARRAGRRRCAAYHRSGQRICVEIPRCGAVGTPAAVVGKIDVKINGRSARKNC